jgi:hypothetical protein
MTVGELIGNLKLCSPEREVVIRCKDKEFTPLHVEWTPTGKILIGVTDLLKDRREAILP